ncbi:latrophilin Cirl-like isoform X2 [Ornithodoros turicata]|uniref:latrophilin Cirl-like isoform X2 n=1 Tax=Ornithodoros turicata TaxID=34597 RepID=UPI003138B965
MHRIVVCGLLLLGILTRPCQSRRGADPPRYRTAYACEGGQLHIACDEGHLVQLIRANYGRFSISICNEHGNLDWSVDCMSHRSFRVMQQSCDLKKGCTLPASTAVFGDPCPGTLKYLEAHYQCIPAESTTTSSPKPPPPLPFPPLVAQDPAHQHGAPARGNDMVPGIIKPPTSEEEKDDVEDDDKEGDDEAEVVQKPQPPPIHRPPYPEHVLDDGFPFHTSSPATASPTDPPVTEPPNPETTPLDLLTGYCQPVLKRDILWNWTRAGDVAVYPCPGGARGDARWQCGVNPVKWLSENPDLSGCNQFWIGDLERRIQDGASVVNLASELAEKSRVRAHYGGDLLHATSIVQQLISRMEDKLDEDSSSYQRHEVVQELMNSVVDFSSNLLEDHQRNAWGDLPAMEQRAAASSLLEGLERNAMLLVKNQHTNMNYSRIQNNIMVSVRVMNLQSTRDLHFPEPSVIRGTSWAQYDDSIYLPYQTLQESSRNGLVKVAFFSYKKMETILDMQFQQQPGLYGEPDSSNITRIINSRVLAAALGRRRVLGLPQPVLITLKHNQEENMSAPQCVFWDFSKRDWSSQGCWVEDSNETHTTCGCDHLTNFAVLMDVRAVKISYSNELALQVITYVGCFVSIVCMLLTIVTFHFLRSIESDRTVIHKNLCICLLIAEVVFVAGISQTAQRVVCGLVAGLLHYFFLAAFMWMFVEGFQLYVMLIEVFDSEKSRLGWYYAASYGIPALIVAVAAAIDPYSYGTQKYCWLRADNYFIFSFVGPVVAILLANLVFLSIAIYMMCRHASLASSVKNKEQSKLANLKIWIRSATVLVFLLGLTWAFGLLYLNEESIVMAYLFTFLNSLQGLFIFVFHCLRNEKVRKEYKKFVRQSSWLPTCLRNEKCATERTSYAHSNGTAASAPSAGQHSVGTIPLVSDLPTLAAPPDYQSVLGPTQEPGFHCHTIYLHEVCYTRSPIYKSNYPIT